MCIRDSIGTTPSGAPRYSPNYGYEAGVHLQFISEFYDDLPELVVFTQAKPTQHNPLFWDTLKCLNSRTNYTSLNWNYQTRGTTYWRKFALQGVVEQCWRDVLDAFGVRLPPKKEPVASFYCCAQMAASRDMIRRHPRAAYEKAYAMLGGAGACHAGELDWATLSVYASSRTRKWDAPRYNRHTAGAWEHLNHVILGGEPLSTPTNGTSALHVACRHGHTRVAEVLLDAGADFDAYDEQGHTPLFLAAAEGQAPSWNVAVDSWRAHGRHVGRRPKRHWPVSYTHLTLPTKA